LARAAAWHQAAPGAASAPWESSFHVANCSGLQVERFRRLSVKNRFVAHAHFPQLRDGALVQVEKYMPTSRPALLVS
jgi:hypothetical protein